MKKIFSILTILAIALPHVSNAKAEQSNKLEKFKAEIRLQYDLKERAFATNDADLVVDQFYSEDVVSVGPDGVVHVGREAIRPGYHEVIGGTVRVESINTHVEGNSGWDWTNFYVTPEDPKADPFSFVIIFLWEKRQGKWWCVGDMFVVGKYDAVSKH